MMSPKLRLATLAFAVAACLLALALVGCGDSGPNTSPNECATLMVDWTDAPSGSDSEAALEDELNATDCEQWEAGIYDDDPDNDPDDISIHDDDDGEVTP